MWEVLGVFVPYRQRVTCRRREAHARELLHKGTLAGWTRHLGPWLRYVFLDFYFLWLFSVVLMQTGWGSLTLFLAEVRPTPCQFFVF